MCARKDFHILLFRILQVCLFMTLVAFPPTNTGAELLNAIVVTTSYRGKNVTRARVSSSPVGRREVSRRKKTKALTRGDQKCRLWRAEGGSAWHYSNGGGGASERRSTCHDDATAANLKRRAGDGRGTGRCASAADRIISIVRTRDCKLVRRTIGPISRLAANRNNNWNVCNL